MCAVSVWRSTPVDSCFREVVVKEHVSLMPCFVGNFSKGIIEHLNSKILRFSPNLNGVLLSYVKPALLHEKGQILDENPHIHFDLTYTAYIFRPMLSSVLHGRVNKVGSDHVGCLFYDCINATVFLNEVYWHDDTSGLDQGSKILFKVTSIDTTGSTLALTGIFLDLLY